MTWIWKRTWIGSKTAEDVEDKPTEVGENNLEGKAPQFIIKKNLVHQINMKTPQEEEGEIPEEDDLSTLEEEAKDLELFVIFVEK